MSLAESENKSPKVIVERLEQFTGISCLSSRGILDESQQLDEQYQTTSHSIHTAGEENVPQDDGENEKSCSDCRCRGSTHSSESEYYVANESLERRYDYDSDDFENASQISLHPSESSSVLDISFSYGSPSEAEADDNDDVEQHESLISGYKNQFEDKHWIQRRDNVKRKLFFLSTECDKCHAGFSIRSDIRQ